MGLTVGGWRSASLEVGGTVQQDKWMGVPTYTVIPESVGGGYPESRVHLSHKKKVNILPTSPFLYSKNG